MAITDELEVLLREDIRQLHELAALLKAEKDSLTASDVKAIAPLTQQKNTLLEQVRERAKQKIHILVKMGYRPESGSPSRFIRSAGLTELHDLWATAQLALDECQAMNSINSRIVSHLQKRLHRLSDIFRGATGQQKLYGASGEQTSVNQRTILASA
ncbi:flagella synthesis protein FlgN [Marinobacter sp. X15-166B]|uniref:flagella synthesis protein FlgN n=1 Tax=Marinobacter sp. X15-166B TaxID=1897620 RepID=UPI00085C41D2|nr:flagellar protein FlgN [Marinobacter sp. X15-166B]OEY67412.1 flagellar biosynthesis protein FlgN [Marinobacter sp. X15-166B]